MKKCAVFFFFFILFRPGAAEFTAGRIKLTLDENRGRFSLYYLSSVENQNYTPLFADLDPGTSFLTLMVNDRMYRLGEAPLFKIRLEGPVSNPALVFESPSVLVTERFSFIQTPGASSANGVQITISITNKENRNVDAALRVLIDTNLGENGEVHFFTDRRLITGEALMTRDLRETYWVSDGGGLGLMGSFSGAGVPEPDLVHFANWRRLTGIPWKLPFSENRSFDFLPYSPMDSAVCYYFDPAVIEAGQSRELIFFLATRDAKGFAVNNTVRIVDDTVRRETSEDLLELKRLTRLIDEYLSSGASDEAIAAVEKAVLKLKTKYGM